MSSQPILFTKIADWRNERATRLKQNPSLRIGFVPTMGALHEGHLSLVRRSSSENDLTVVSVFVNPTQFDDKKDLDAYPRTLESDVKMLAGEKVDFVFAPSAAEMYPDGYHYRIQENEISPLLCGAHRPGHFDGMLTVVMKFFQVVSPHRAYFGEKDFQQLQLVKGMARNFFLGLEVVGCPIVRESDGLAMSSRNARLGAADREKAARLHRILSRTASAQEARSSLEGEGFEVDYVEERWGRRLGAIRVGGVRLIDNVVKGKDT